MICPKLCGNCAFLQNFRTRKLGEITVFYAVKLEQRLYSSRTLSPFLLHKRDKIWNLLIINNRPKWRHLLFRKQIGDVLKFAPVRLLALSLILTSCFGHKNLVYKTRGPTRFFEKIKLEWRHLKKPEWVYIVILGNSVYLFFISSNWRGIF